MALRIAFRTNPHSTGELRYNLPMVDTCLTVNIGLYIVCYLFVVLSPCAFLAGDYILLGRLVQYLDAHHYLRPLRAQLVSWIFIISDGKQLCAGIVRS